MLKYNFIIPYRNREEHLKYFINIFESFDIKDKDCQFLVVHQKDDRLFNRGALMNIGFLEFLKTRPDGIFIFHDVDIYPTFWESINYNTQKGTFRHPAYGTPNHNLGTICCCWKEEFEKVNGFPNYWGWGIEDITLMKRVQKNNITIDESNPAIFHTNRCYHPPHSKNHKEIELTMNINGKIDEQESKNGLIIDGFDKINYKIINETLLSEKLTIKMIDVDFQVIN